ncbi:hypothetical protein GGF46_001253 [Coemansia sp. RSA 552]|nr:hypothetical protein GGF46_001253 [Coemansia sp. RSA 552]
MVMLFQTNVPHSVYNGCEETSDSGIVAGILNFNTMDGNVYRVVSNYNDREGANTSVFSDFLPTLKDYADSGSSSLKGLKGTFCDAWRSLDGDSIFNSAQDEIWINDYRDPGEKVAVGAGLSFTLSMIVLTDTAIYIGSPNDSNKLQKLVDATNDKVVDYSGYDDIESGKMMTVGDSGVEVDEIKWLRVFLDLREKKYKGQAKMNLKTYRELIKQRQWQPDFPVTAYNWNNKPVTICEW